VSRFGRCNLYVYCTVDVGSVLEINRS